MITLFTAYTDTPEWNELADITVPVMQEYADKRGYKLVVKKECGNGKFSSFPMHKTSLVYYYRKENPDDTLWVLDLDILITNLYIPIEKWTNSGLSLTRDINGVNSGSYIMPCDFSDEGLKILHSVVSIDKLVTSENHAFQILCQLSQYPLTPNIFPHPSINSIPYHLYPEIGRRKHEEGQWECGDLTCHLPGMNLADRVRIFKEISKEIVR